MRRKAATTYATALVLTLTGGAMAAGEKQGEQHQPSEHQQGAQLEQGAQPEQGAQQQEGAQEQESAQKEEGAQKKASMKLDPEQAKGLQQKLQDKGHYKGNIDGIVGPQTTAALRDFQSENDLAVTGMLNDETRQALGLAEGGEETEPTAGTEEMEAGAAEEPEKERAAQREATETAVGTEAIQLSAIDEEQVRALQTKLQELGYYRAKIDGIVGPKTRAALQQFYRKNAQLAARGMITEDGASAFGLDVSEMEPVRGKEEQPSKMEEQPKQQPPSGTEQQPPSGTQQPPSGESGEQQAPAEQQRPPSGSDRPGEEQQRQGEGSAY